MKKRFGSILLTLALLVSLAPMLGGEAKAANPSKLYLGSPNDWSMTYEDMLTTVRVTPGDYDVAEYNNGTLRLTNWYTSTQGYYSADNLDYTAVLYCEGDLTLELIGDNYLGCDPDKINTCLANEAKQYGIYVNGNLTIKNATNETASLYVAAYEEQAEETAAGIYCTGKLTIQQQSGGTLTVTAEGSRAANKSRGVYTTGFMMSGGTLNATGGAAAGTGGSAGLELGTGATSANPISVTGGTITASGGTVPDATDYSNGSYGVRFTSGNQSTSRFFLSTGGTVIAKGYTFAAWPYGRLAAPKLLSSTSYDGTGKKVSPCDSEYTKYVELDTGSVGIAMTGWNYGDYYADTNGPVYCTALGGITITYKGRAGTNYTESTTLPTNAGNYTATATYKGKTGTADFTISKLSDPATVTNASVNCGDSIDLAEYVSGAKGTVSFSFRGDQHYGCTISGSTFTAGTTAATVLLTVTVANSTNYTGKSLDMSVNVASREAAGVSFTTGDALTKFAGDNPFELLCAVANFGEGTEVWTWQISDENVVTVQDWGNFTEGHKAIATIHGTGTATITVRYHSDTAAGSATLTLTVLDNNAAIPKPTASVNGTTLTWSAAMPESGKSVTAVAAWYDTNGKLLGCKTDTFTASGPVSGKTIDVASGAAKYKLFLLDGNSCPLCEAWDSTKAT